MNSSLSWHSPPKPKTNLITNSSAQSLKKQKRKPVSFNSFVESLQFRAQKGYLGLSQTKNSDVKRKTSEPTFFSEEKTKDSTKKLAFSSFLGSFDGTKLFGSPKLNKGRMKNDVFTRLYSESSNKSKSRSIQSFRKGEKNFQPKKIYVDLVKAMKNEETPLKHLSPQKHFFNTPNRILTEDFSSIFKLDSQVKKLEDSPQKKADSIYERQLKWLARVKGKSNSSKVSSRIKEEESRIEESRIKRDQRLAELMLE